MSIMTESSQREQKGDDRPIGECLDEFWAAGDALETVWIRPRTSAVADAALSRLAQPPAGLDRIHGELTDGYIEMTDDEVS